MNLRFQHCFLHTYERQDCDDGTGSLEFASESLLDALLDRAIDPHLLRTANHDWESLVHTFHGILHPTAVQPLLNLKDNIQVRFLFLF